MPPIVPAWDGHLPTPRPVTQLSLSLTSEFEGISSVVGVRDHFPGSGSTNEIKVGLENERKQAMVQDAVFVFDRFWGH